MVGSTATMPFIRASMTCGTLGKSLGSVHLSRLRNGFWTGRRRSDEQQRLLDVYRLWVDDLHRSPPLPVYPRFSVDLSRCEPLKPLLIPTDDIYIDVTVVLDRHARDYRCHNSDEACAAADASDPVSDGDLFRGHSLSFLLPRSRYFEKAAVFSGGCALVCQIFRVRVKGPRPGSVVSFVMISSRSRLRCVQHRRGPIESDVEASAPSSRVISPVKTRNVSSLKLWY